MFFYNPYSRPDPAGCFGTILALLVVMAIIIACIVYFGAFILLGFLILGAVIGLVFAIIAYLKAIPQAVADIKYATFTGNAFTMWLKRVITFIFYVGKYAITNNAQYANTHYQKFQSKQTLSFTKWMNLITAFIVLVAGVSVIVLMTLLLLFAVISLVCALLFIVIDVIILFLAIGIAVHLFLTFKQMITDISSVFFPICFIFSGNITVIDIPAVAKKYFNQLVTWNGNAWSAQRAFVAGMAQNSQMRAWYSPYSVLTILLTITMPIGSFIAQAVCSLISVIVFIPIYIVDALLMLIKSFI